MWNLNTPAEGAVSVWVRITPISVHAYSQRFQLGNMGNGSQDLIAGIIIIIRDTLLNEDGVGGAKKTLATRGQTRAIHNSFLPEWGGARASRSP